MRQEFGLARTICDCRLCVTNCHFIPGYLIPDDLARISAKVGVENVLEFALANLLASPGATVITYGGEQHQIPTLVPARRADGACKFLSAENRCTIHEVAPFACAFFDVHQSREESDRGSIQGLMAIDAEWRDPTSTYSLLWLMLDAAGLKAPAPMVARAKMRAALAVMENAQMQGATNANTAQLA